MSLPQFQSGNQPFQLMQSAWASAIDPMLQNPSLQTQLLKNISLSVGTNVINHKLSRVQQGWRIVDVTSAAHIYRSAPLNATTLTLTSDAATTIALEVF